MKERPYVRKVEPVLTWMSDEKRGTSDENRVLGYRVVVVDTEDKVKQRTVYGDMVVPEWAARVVLGLFTRNVI